MTATLLLVTGLGISALVAWAELLTLPTFTALERTWARKLTLVEVPVHMRLRGAGQSSITFRRSAYYMLKVLLALFVGLFRRYPIPQEEDQQ